MRRHSQIGLGFTDLLLNALLGFVVMLMPGVVEVAGRLVTNPLNQETVSIRGILPGEYA